MSKKQKMKTTHHFGTAQWEQLFFCKVHCSQNQFPNLAKPTLHMLLQVSKYSEMLLKVRGKVMEMCHQLLTFPAVSLDQFTVVVDTVHLLRY